MSPYTVRVEFAELEIEGKALGPVIVELTNNPPTGSYIMRVPLYLTSGLEPSTMYKVIATGYLTPDLKTGIYYYNGLLVSPGLLHVTFAGSDEK